MTKDEKELLRLYLKKEIAKFLKENSERILQEFSIKYNIDVTTAKEDKNDAPISNDSGNT